MITVLTIIIIVLAVAIPIWDAMMNGTNLSTGQNEISAFLANARADAIYNRQTIGVFFYIDPKTTQTGMAEVQVQTLYQPNPYGGGAPTYTSIFQPGIWASPWSSWTASWTKSTASNGPVYSLELVNNPDPNNPGNYVFYRDTVLLPKGVAVALNSSSWSYNENNAWQAPPPTGAQAVPPLDRYVRMGCIMFNPDGSLASIPYGVPYYEAFTQTQYTNANNHTIPPPDNLLCQKIGMYLTSQDLASNVIYSQPANPAVQPQFLPLMSSPGLVIYDHDAYLTQHAVMQAMNSATNPPTGPVTLGDSPPDQFTDTDLDYSVTSTPPSSPPTTSAPIVQDKFIEENWIDQNGTAFLVSPFNGTLIKAK